MGREDYLADGDSFKKDPELVYHQLVDTPLHDTVTYLPVHIFKASSSTDSETNLQTETT